MAFPPAGIVLGGGRANGRLGQAIRDAAQETLVRCGLERRLYEGGDLDADDAAARPHWNAPTVRMAPSTRVPINE